MATAAIIGAIMLAAGPLPSYDAAIRCAALAEAASRAPAADGARRSKMFDVALFWGLAASEVARKRAIPAVAFTEDQKAAAARAAGELAAGDGAAAAELAACEAQTPPL